MLKKVFTIVLMMFISCNLFAKNIANYEFKASMDCKHCQNTIEKALKSTQGINKVKTNLKTKTVKVVYDKDMIDNFSICKIVNDLGYTVSSEDGINLDKPVEANEVHKELKSTSEKKCCEGKEGKCCNKEHKCSEKHK